jgi:hypothetical protein
MKDKYKKILAIEDNNSITWSDSPGVLKTSNMKKTAEQYTEGLDMKQFGHIPEISQYNHNYYNGFGNDLLYGESDDDSTTEWYLVNKSGSQDFNFIGISHIDCETLNVK